MSRSGRPQLVGLGAALAALLAPSSAQESGQPKLVLSQTTWDFGVLQHPQKTELSLKLSNGGPATLRIAHVKSSCGCTVATPGKLVLAAGESTDLKIAYDSYSKEGEVTAEITIASNDPAQPETKVQVKGVVRRSVRIDAAGILFRMLEPTEARSQTVRLKNLESEPLRPALGSFTSGKFAAELREIEAGREYAIVISTRPPFPEEPVTDKLEIRTGLAAEPSLTVAVKTLLIERVELVPPAVYALPKATERAKRMVRVNYYGDFPDFKITNVVCDDPNVKSTWNTPAAAPPDDPGQLQAKVFQIINLDLPPTAQIPAQGIPVKIFTSDPAYPEVKMLITPDMTKYRELSNQRRRAAAKSSP